MSFFVLQLPPPFFLCSYLFALFSKFFYTNANNTFMYICNTGFVNHTGINMDELTEFSKTQTQTRVRSFIFTSYVKFLLTFELIFLRNG